MSKKVKREPYCKEGSPDAALTEFLRCPPAEPLMPSLDDVTGSVTYLRMKQDRRFSPVRNVNMSAVVNGLCPEFVESDTKGINALIFADMHGDRYDSSAQTGSAFGFDFDNSVRDVAHEIIEPLRRRGLTAIAYHTHSHGKTETLIECEKVLVDDKPPTVEQLYESRVVKKDHLNNIRFDISDHERHYVHNDNGHFYRVEHDPVVRFRVIIFLRTPVPISLVGLDGWKAMYLRLARKVWGDIPIDETCKNVGSLFYLPAKPPGVDRGHRIWHLDGQPLAWEPLWSECESEIADRRRRIAERRESMTPADESDIRTCLESIPAGCDYATWFKVVAAIHHETDGEGFGLADWWSQGDPQSYDEDALGRLWDSLDSSDYDGEPATMGSLVHLAQKHNPLFRRENDVAGLFA